mgnify:CR=1 FL=1
MALPRIPRPLREPSAISAECPIAAKVHHLADGVRDGSREIRRHDETDEVADGTHGDGSVRVDGARADSRGDRVGRVGCAVDEDSADDEDRDDGKHGVRDQCADENAEADHELSPLPGVPGVRQGSATPGRTNPHILMLCGISHAVVASM